MIHGPDILAFWSGVALIFRIIAIVIFVYVGQIQLRQFKIKSELQPLKKSLMALIVLLGLSNVPIMYLHLIRIWGDSASAAVTSAATVSNAISMLLAAIVLIMIYKFSMRDEE